MPLQKIQPQTETSPFHGDHQNQAAQQGQAARLPEIEAISCLYDQLLREKRRTWYLGDGIDMVKCVIASGIVVGSGYTHKITTSFVMGFVVFFLCARPLANLLLRIPLPKILQPQTLIWSRLLKELSRVTDRQVTGLLLDFSRQIDARPNFVPRQAREAVEKAVAHFLPEFTADEARVLTLTQRKYLRRTVWKASWMLFVALSSEEKETIVVASLLALGMAGDTKALKTARRLAKKAKNERVRAAAQEASYLLIPPAHPSEA